MLLRLSRRFGLALGVALITGLALPGVASARVDVDARTVTVEVDETVTDCGRLVAAIEDQGYDVPA